MTQPVTEHDQPYIGRRSGRLHQHPASGGQGSGWQTILTFGLFMARAIGRSAYLDPPRLFSLKDS